MAKYKLFKDEVEIYFDTIPSNAIREKMKAVKIWWNPSKKCWHAKKTSEVMAVAKEICDESLVEDIFSESEVKIDEEARCCYVESIDQFLKEEKMIWISKMKSNFNNSFPLTLSDSQVKAWEDCFDVLKNELPNISNKYPGLQIIFEYSLPYESGRRPDVIVLSEKQVIVLEFKQYGEILQVDIDQVKAYVRDIREYHFESRNKEIIPVLVLTGIENQNFIKQQGVIICSRGRIEPLFEQVLLPEIGTCDAKSWINSKYEPLPTIVDAARNFMNREDLPNIRRVNSTVIPEAVKCLTEIAIDAKENNKHVLALVTGVPGSGKTYLGLQYVYDICESNKNVNSVYLSGNGALVKVLQDALKSKVFVQNVHNVINEYNSGKMITFNKNIVVFDEGQRAWDKNQMYTKRKVNKSEPDLILELCDNKLNWGVLLILVGEGQEIYNGENSGISQWNTALRNTTNNWEIVCPNKLEHFFGENVKINDALDLKVSLRSHAAGEVSDFINAFIDGDLEKAHSKSISLIKNGFNMYFTRDLNRAKQYCYSRYPDSNSRQFGMIASSKSRNLKRYNMAPKYQPDVAAWFNGKPSDLLNEITISEFDCQGLEIDMPIIGWGDDIQWKGNRWIALGDNQDDIAYRINSYRVLLTRGRDGFIVFIPNVKEMDIIERVFREAGVKKLENN